MVNLSQLSLPTCFFEKKKDKNSGGDEDENDGGDGDNYCRKFGKDDVAAAGYASANDAVHNAAANRERMRGVPWTEENHRQSMLGLQNNMQTRTPTEVASHIAPKYVIPRISISRRPSLFEIKVIEDNDEDDNDNNNVGDGDDHNTGGGGGGGDDHDNGGSGGNNNNESRDCDANGNKDKRSHGGGYTNGKNMDFTGEGGFGYGYAYHAGYENGYPVGQLKRAQKVQ